MNKAKALVLDVATASWRMLTPEVCSDYNYGWSRAANDQKQ